MKSLFPHCRVGRFKIFSAASRFLICCTLVFTSMIPSADAQDNLLDKRININLDQATLPDALSVIAEKAGCTFSYSSSSLPADKRVSIQRNYITLTAALKEILGSSLEKLQAQGNKVLIVLKKPSGTIKGTVKTSDGKPAAFVTISIKNVSTTFVDANGKYQLKNIPEGTYQITASFIGLNTQTQQITIQADRSATADFILSESSAQLSEVLIRGNKTNQFAAKESDQIARLPLKNLENPQTYNLVTNAVIKERNITNYAEIFYNAPGVTPPSVTYSAGNEYFIRGIYTSSAEFRNGLKTYDAEAEDPVNIDHVEILKGPSATLFGTANGAFGGVINNVTKTPFKETRGELGYSGGSFNLSRFTLDYNTALNKDSTMLFRINGARHRENSFQDYGFKHTYTIAPSLLYQINDRLSLRLDAEFYHQNSSMWQWNSFGEDVTIRNIKDLNVPYNRSAAGDQMTEDWSSSKLYGRADYKISDHWTSSTNFSQNIYRRNESYYMNGNQYINDSTLVRSIMGARPQIANTTQVQQNFNGDFNIAGMRNRIVIGLDFSSTKINSTFVGRYSDTVVMSNPASKVNVPREKILNAFTMDPSDFHIIATTSVYSAYVSDVLNVTDRLLAMASLRVDRFVNGNTIWSGVNQEDKFDQTALSPKFGLVYQVVKDQVSLFGNYMNGFSNNAPQVVGADVVNFKPSQGNQWEGGIKASVLQHKLSATLSYYDIAVKDALRFDNNLGATIQDGNEHSHGFEAELIANPVTGLNIMAGYSYNDSKYLETNNGGDGMILGAPKNIANFYVSYRLNTLIEGLGAGFGGNYVDESRFNAPIVVPSYFVCNAQLMYDQPKFGLSFKVNNLTDEKYWSWNFIQAQPTRSFVAGATFKF